MRRKSIPNKRSAAREQIIFNALRHGATIKSACKQAGVSTTAFERWRAIDPQFALTLQQIKAELKRREDYAMRTS